MFSEIEHERLLAADPHEAAVAGARLLRSEVRHQGSGEDGQGHLKVPHQDTPQVRQDQVPPLLLARNQVCIPTVVAAFVAVASAALLRHGHGPSAEHVSQRPQARDASAGHDGQQRDRQVQASRVLLLRQQVSDDGQVLAKSRQAAGKIRAKDFLRKVLHLRRHVHVGMSRYDRNITCLCINLF